MKKAPAEKKCRGTVVAEKERAKANAFSDDQRQHLLARGLELIYGKPAYGRARRPGAFTTMQFLDAGATNFNRRFYRAMSR